MNSTVPSRHPDQPRALPVVLRVYARLLGIREPGAARWDRLGSCLVVGDDAMDDLVEWMRSEGLATTRPLFDLALRAGIAAVPNAPEPLRVFFTATESVPDWVDWELIRRGQRALRAGGADGISIARDVALLGGYQFAGFNQTLLRTGALLKGSNKRFAETAQWALDVITEDGLAPGGIGYQATIQVRLVHAFVRRHVAAMPDWRQDEWGLPVNQTDMAATLLGALIAPSVGAIGMGIVHSRADYNSIAHLTRYVGWLIGVQDEWLPRSYRDAVRGLCHTIMALSEPDETTRLLARPMVDDPLSWSYDSLGTVRRRLARAQHLSISSAFLGPRAMRSLGLPAYVPPWYPLLRVPVNGLRSIAALTIPGGRDRAAARGWAEQRAFLRTVTSAPAVVIGAPAVVAESRVTSARTAG